MSLAWMREESSFLASASMATESEMKTRIVFAILVLLSAIILFGRPAWSQTENTAEDQIAVLRADLKQELPEIISDAMQFKPGEAKAFWPVYNQYAKELSALNDSLIQLAKMYTRDFGTISDAEASDLARKAFNLQSERIELKKRYFSILSKATSPLLAAKFFQIEHRLELIVDLKIASELPALFVQPGPVAEEAK